MRYFELRSYEKIIADIDIDTNSRDDIPKVLLGLKYLYLHYKHHIVDRLYLDLAKRVKLDTGRLGMELWRAFVLCTLRVNLNWDFDRLHNMMNRHADIRALLGHELSDPYQYKLQTVKDNYQLFSCEVINEISTLIVNIGHDVLKKNDSELNINTRCDSFPVQSNVHFPTDISLLFDAGRKMLSLSRYFSIIENISGWRQVENNQLSYKKAYDKVRMAKRAQKKASKNKSNINSENSTLPYNKAVRDAHEEFIKYALFLLDRADELTFALKILSYTTEVDTKYRQLEGFINDMSLLIDQIDRRVLKGETIPTNEKLYSIFERYTEWLDKGKQPKSIDLGLNICIMEDQHGFILHHHVMENEVDKEIAISMVVSTKDKHNTMKSCSFDKGFYTEKNKLTISGLLERLCMPKKGKKSQEEIEEEHEHSFITDRKQHSAVESAVNALQAHGLKRCLDRGINHFKRYISVSIMARNIQQLGSILLKQPLLQEEVFAKAA